MSRRWSFAEGVKEFAAQQEKFASQECGASTNIVHLPILISFLVPILISFQVPIFFTSSTNFDFFSITNIVHKPRFLFKISACR